MGSGASAEATKTAEQLISTIKNGEGSARIKAMSSLWELLKQSDDYKPGIGQAEGLLQSCIKTLGDETADEDSRLYSSRIICSITTHIDAKLIVAREPGVFEAAIIALNDRKIRDDKTLQNAITIVRNCAILQSTHIYLLKKDLGLLPLLYNLAKSDVDKELNRTLKVSAWASLGNMAGVSKEDMVQCLLDNSIHKLAVDLLRPLDKSSTGSWQLEKSEYASWIVLFLMNFCRHEQAALAVKSIGGDDVLNPIVTISHPMANRFIFTSGVNIYASFATAFVAGRDEGKKSSGKRALLVEVPKALDYLLEAFTNTFNLEGGTGYQFGLVKLPAIVGALAILAISDGNKRVLVNSGALYFVMKVLEHFINGKELIGVTTTGTTSAGGGSNDLESASLAIEALVQLSFFYDDHDDDLRATYMNPKYNMISFIDNLLERPPNPLTIKDKGNLMILRNRLIPPAIPAVEEIHDPIIDTTQSSNVHVMMSYAWEANKNHVAAVTDILKQNGIDVWRDETGSSKLRPMSGDIMETMVEAIRLSNLFIVCLSEAYKRRPNCRSEGQMIRKKQMKGFKIIFLMMDQSFIDEVDDTWLAVMLGAELWYPLWDASNISGTASTLVKLIKGQEAVVTEVSVDLPPSPSTKTPSISTPKQGSTKPADFDAAWTIISSCTTSQALPVVLEELGIADGSDLSGVGNAALSFFPHLLKPVQKKKLIEALNITDDAAVQLKQADFEGAHALITSVSTSQALPLVLEEVGIADASDLAQTDISVLVFIPELLKPVQKKKLLDLLGFV